MSSTQRPLSAGGRRSAKARYRCPKWRRLRLSFLLALLLGFLSLAIWNAIDYPRRVSPEGLCRSVLGLDSLEGLENLQSFHAGFLDHRTSLSFKAEASKIQSILEANGFEVCEEHRPGQAVVYRRGEFLSAPADADFREEVEVDWEAETFSYSSWSH